MPQPIMTLTEGLAIQTAQLDRWAKVLKPAVFAEIRKTVNERNKELEAKIISGKLAFNDYTGYEVFRGTDIDNLVINYVDQQKMD